MLSWLKENIKKIAVATLWALLTAINLISIILDNPLLHTLLTLVLSLAILMIIFDVIDDTYTKTTEISKYIKAMSQSINALTDLKHFFLNSSFQLFSVSVMT